MTDYEMTRGQTTPSLMTQYSGVAKSDDEAIKEFRKVLISSRTSSQEFWSQARIDSNLYTGNDEGILELYNSLPLWQLKQLNLNRVKTTVDSITGFQRKNRKSLLVIPEDESDQETADQRTKMLYWQNNRIKGDYVFSDAFRSACISGIALMRYWVDHRLDTRSGQIKLDMMDYNEFIIDEYFTKIDLSDCRYIITGTYIDKNELVSLYPEKEEELMRSNLKTKESSDFIYLPQNFSESDENYAFVHEYWHRVYRRARVIENVLRGEYFEWKGSDDDLRGILAKYPDLKESVKDIDSVERVVVLNAEIILKRGNPYNIDRYPFTPVLCNQNKDQSDFYWRYYGVPRNLRDSQYMYNRAKYIESQLLYTQLQSGVKLMDDALVDPNDIFDSDPGKVYMMRSDSKYGMGSLEKVPTPNLDPSLFAFSEGFATEMSRISGVNEELLGSAIDDKAGILSALRQSAGLTTLNTPFDLADESYKNHGLIINDLIINNYTMEKVARVLGELPTENFFNNSFDKYDCRVVEGSDTISQKQMSLQQALYFKEMGVPIPDSFLIKQSTLQDKTDLIETMEAEQKGQAEQQQQQQQLQLAQLEAQIRLANARAVADEGLGVERLSRINENQALAYERRAKAVSDLEAASLDQIKAAKELTDIDLGQLMKAVELIERLQAKTLRQPMQALEAGGVAPQVLQAQENESI